MILHANERMKPRKEREEKNTLMRKGDLGNSSLIVEETIYFFHFNGISNYFPYIRHLRVLPTLNLHTNTSRSKLVIYFYGISNYFP